jgi:hypothetical protein
MAKPNQGAEGSDDPRNQPEPPEQTRDPAGAGAHATGPGGDRLTAQLDKIRHHPVVLEQQAQRAADLQLRIADRITAFAGSNFVYLHIALFTIWMLFIESKQWPTLTLVVSLEAIFLSTFVMIGITGSRRSSRPRRIMISTNRNSILVVNSGAGCHV